MTKNFWSRILSPYTLLVHTSAIDCWPCFCRLDFLRYHVLDDGGMEPPPVFKYDSLEPKRSIRLLRISDSKKWDDPIALSLTTHPLSEGAFPKYTALSYTWGDSGRNVEVFIDGARIMITESLSEALRHLRRTQQHRDDIGRLWWVDMLCIDQMYSGAEPPGGYDKGYLPECQSRGGMARNRPFAQARHFRQLSVAGAGAGLWLSKHGRSFWSARDETNFARCERASKQGLLGSHPGALCGS